MTDNSVSYEGLVHKAALLLTVLTNARMANKVYTCAKGLKLKFLSYLSCLDGRLAIMIIELDNLFTVTPSSTTIIMN